jgi:hypothetical protein
MVSWIRFLTMHNQPVRSTLGRNISEIRRRSSTLSSLLSYIRQSLHTVAA